MSIKPIHTYVGAPNCERGRSTVLGVCPKGETVAYGCGNNLILRNIKDPLKVDWYTDHASTVMVAKWAPSGYYIASGDASGVVRIWSTDNVDKTLKLETKPLSGPIRDIAWASDSLRVVVVGEGKEGFASVFLFDTGSSVGSIGGHSKQILSVDHSPKRPHVIITGGEDFYVNFYKGPPFKTLDQSNRDVHNKYVNCVRWAPSGDQFCSASSDKTVVFYDGKTGQKTATLDKTGAHSGTIFSCAWNPESSKLLTVSGDKTAKVWDSAAKTILKTVTIGGAIEDQQVSSVWPTSDLALSVSLNGTINYIAPNDDSTAPVQQLHGHNTPIYRILYDAKTGMFYSCASEGVLIQWEYGKAKTKLISGKFEKSSFNTLVMAGKELVTTSLDGNLRFVNLDKFALEGDAIKLNGTPNDICVTSDGSTIVVACHNGVQVINNKKIVGFTQTKYEPTCISISPDDKTVVIGGSDRKIHLCDLKKDGVAEVKLFEDKHQTKLTSIKYSPDGKLIASGDSGREIIVWDSTDYSPKYTQLTFHTSAITDMSWSADSQNLVSGSTDGNIIVWDFANTKRILHSSHPQGTKSVQFIDGNTVLSAGADFRIRSFQFSWEKK